ncbi:MAG: hypothetical protein UMR38_05575 [Candidatus Izemoplasma sp.]|nr:hypothetical protein [Candidatus Izemoplasma sp.]
MRQTKANTGLLIAGISIIPILFGITNTYVLIIMDIYILTVLFTMKKRSYYKIVLAFIFLVYTISSSILIIYLNTTTEVYSMVYNLNFIRQVLLLLIFIVSITLVIEHYTQLLVTTFAILVGFGLSTHYILLFHEIYVYLIDLFNMPFVIPAIGNVTLLTSITLIIIILFKALFIRQVIIDTNKRNEYHRANIN